ncbi:FAD-binding protein [Methylophilus glucosoxydans]|uniref:FAD-binding protein n=1 Tax=Methylophilus glucosoxydans TaxID=752553 RepID=A0ABW3GPT4_9PROT
MDTKTTVIVGNALAGMVAALELARQGKKVTLVNPGGPLGGYFAGLEIDGVMFDAGLVKFELDGYLSQNSTLASYNPKLRNDVGRFMNIVHAWALQYAPLHQFDMPKMWLQNKAYDDVVLSNSYHTFSQLPFAQQSIQELQQLPAAEIHAREKSNGARYHTLDYLTASLANHGKAMHDHIIAPYLMKAQGVTADKMLARYHRVAWLPLFYPETLLASFQGKAVPLQPTVFHYPKQGAVGGICRQVKQQVLSHPNITYVQQAIQTVEKNDGGWRLQLGEGAVSGPIEGGHLVWTGAPAALLKALGKQPTMVQEIKSPIAVLFLRIKKADIRDVYTILHVLDMDKCAYRITNQTACADQQDEDMNIVVEFNQNYFKQLYGENDSDAFIVEKLLAELAAMNMIAADAQPLIAAIKRIPGGFLVPDQAARDAWEQDQQTVAALHPEIALLAMSSGFFATSLNDQVIQGLYYAETRLDAEVETVKETLPA